MDIEGQQVFLKSSEHMDEVESRSVTLVVTSPPYWNVRDYNINDQIGFGQSYKEYIDSLNRVWKDCLRVLQPNGKIAINVQPLPIPGEKSGFDFRVICDIMHDIEAFFRDHDCFLSGMIFWNKAAYVNNVSWGSYPKPTNIATNTSFEQIYTFVKRGDTRKVPKEVMERNLLTKDEWRHWAVRCVWDDISPVIKINAKGENLFGHGAPFPEDIPYRLVKMHTVEGELVLDPFLGSGTTLKITRILKRKGIGYELNKAFEPLIRERIKEDWKPPAIESHYRSVGNETMAKIIKSFYDFSKHGKIDIETRAFYSGLIDQLRKALPDLFSSAYLKNIKKELGLVKEMPEDD
nr:DNA methyltransferase [Candidatus Sigynarchaeota archaeon]